MREFWSRTQQCGVVCTLHMVLQSTSQDAWQSLGQTECPAEEQPSFQTSESSCLPGIMIAPKLLVCFLSLVAYNHLMGICKQLSQHRHCRETPKPSCSAAGAANKCVSAAEQAQREDCNTYSPPGYAHTAQTAG